MSAGEFQGRCEDFRIRCAKSHQGTPTTAPRARRPYERLRMTFEIELLICRRQLDHRRRIVRIAQRGEDASVGTKVRVSLMRPLDDTRNTQRELSEIGWGHR